MSVFKIRKLTMFLAGILCGLVLFATGDRLADQYWKTQFKTFSFYAATSEFQEVVSSQDVERLTQQFGEVVGWLLARANAKGDKKNFAQLEILLDSYNKYDQEMFMEWLRQNPKMPHIKPDRLLRPSNPKIDL